MADNDNLIIIGNNLVGVRNINVSKIKIPDYVTNIDDHAFYGCYYLAEVVIPKSVTRIGNRAFLDCSSLRELVIPDSVTQIDEYAFCRCASLSSVVLPNSITRIDEGLFKECSLLTHVVIPNSVVSIEPYAFEECLNLTNITIPNSVKEIATSAFRGCSSLVNINIPNSVTTIGERAFSGCRALTSIEIPQSVTELGEEVFASCVSLTDVSLPNSIKTINQFTFAGCTSLYRIVIPSSVTNIEKGGFSRCWSLEDIVIPNSVTNIGESAFQHCATLASIALPNSITKIETNLFEHCISLRNVVIPDSVTSIGSGAFGGCSALTNIDIPNSVTKIYTFAFEECTALTSIVIPDSVTEIYNFVFRNCSSLNNVVLPNTLKAIGYGAFTKCTALTSIVIPNSVTSIEMETFYGCSSLTHVTIPNSITKISASTFAQCTALKNIIIPDSVAIIDANAFSNCTSLTNITIPSSVNEIGLYAFGGCSSLADVVISSSNTHISSNAFIGCSSLNNIKIHIDNNNYSMVKNLAGVLSFDHARLTKTKAGFDLELSKDELTASNKDQRCIDNPFLLNYYIKFFNDERKLSALDRIDSGFSKYFFDREISMRSADEEIDPNAFSTYNLKSINNLLKAIKGNSDHIFNTAQDEYDFFKLCENLGVLNVSPTTIKTISKSGNEITQTIDYSQKAREFLKDRILEGTLSIEQIHAMFDSMKTDGFKQGFADFFLNKNNFNELMAEERNQSGFIARCYNEFEMVQFAHTSQRGSQRQLAPTVEFFKDYFISSKFQGVTHETRKIAEAISPYFSQQKDFENAVKIDQERREKDTPDNILGDEVIREEGVFEKVDSLLKSTKDISIDTTATLVDLANRKFTFELLNKSDPLNFVLGKLCSCCAHLEGAGNGIMRASIVHPDVQNIVIRDKTGKIVTKSTLYVNREEGYAVCNNVEVNTNVDDEDYKLIYLKFKKAVKTFAEKYNAKYPDKPLKIITVGMHLNDLSDEIKESDDQSTILYQALDYGKYAYDGSSYSGDSSQSQYIVWETDKTDGQTI